MGKHSGKDAVEGPFGPGPHPTPEESQRLADSFDRQVQNNQRRAEEKRERR